MRRHRKSHEEGIHACTLCSSVFDSLIFLERHVDRVHISYVLLYIHHDSILTMFLDPVIYKCGTCSKSFGKWSELRKHVQTDHPFQCSACKKIYSKPYNLKQHIKEKHMNEEVITCDWPGCESKIQTVSVI